MAVSRRAGWPSLRKVAPGTDYHPGLQGHVRLNTATSPERLGLVVERLAAAVRR